MPGRFYVTTPIYYVNDAPHIGHAYTTVTADALARWHRLLGDDAFFLTGTDEHGLKVAAGGRGRTASPRRSRPTAPAQRFREAWELLDISQRRLHPHHRAAPPRRGAGVPAEGLRQRPHLHGTYEGLVLRVVRGVLHRGRPRSTATARSTTGRSRRSRRRTTSSGCRPFEQPLLDWYRGRPRRRPARRQAQRGARLHHARASTTSRSAAPRIDWGVPVPWDDGHVFYVWYDALINYATAIGYGTDHERFADVVAGRAPPHRQGHPPLPLRLLAGDAAGRRASSRPHRVDVHGFLLVGGEKMCKTQRSTRSLPADLVDDFGVDGFRYHFLRDQPFGPDGDFTTRAWSPATTPTWPTTSATCCRGWPPWWPRSATASAPPPRPTARSPPWPPRPTPTPPRRGPTSQPSVALDATWRLIREANAYLEANEPWKIEPGPEVDARAWATPSRCCASSPILASPALPDACRRDLARASASPARPTTSACPTPRPGAATRAACRREGRPALPPHQGLT